MSRKFVSRMAVSAILIVALAALAVFAAPHLLVQTTHAQSQTMATPAPVVVHPQTESEATFADIYNQASASVVAINVTKAVDNPFFGMQGGEARGLGSGFILDAAGHIVTNDHVVDGADSIEVSFVDGTLARAHVVGLDPDSDIAVIQVEDVPADKLHPITFGDSDSLYVGETVLAIGSPFGERWTLTSGIVSGLDRVISGVANYSIAGAIQTDASINPGNSGGPLLDLDGQVVGMNAQIMSQSGTSSGVGFAIPSNLINRVADELINTGKADYSYLGLQGGDISLDVIDALNLPNDTRGVVVGDVADNSPAADAGLHPAEFHGTRDSQQLQSADIITAIDGQPIYNMGDLIGYLAANTQPGDTITLSVLRDGAQLQLDVNLTARPSATT